ncbi:lipolytic protein g-d-s-l family [Methylobacterium variabile]|jgi:lysophospholipase L1-like esterase|uniref:Lipolytic protein g-d-s-l family n=1 Tax=Methylobacterium variabile TaxID=298794 RepID=A0A0J6SLZ7_9HYPH|nr:GDSL-type esterase/lipase family protein [Methylobacterium variabile]KMO34647.1 lipolytic protein g-d-s-l family [Methylobacterium variabile]
MAHSLSPSLLGGVSLAMAACLVLPARAQTPREPAHAEIPSLQATAPSPDAPDPSLSPECRVPGSKLYTLAKLKAVKKALREHRAVQVLAIGSTSGGLGTAATYPVRLEDALTRSLPDIEVTVESRGVSGEIASGAAERLRNSVAELEPDLVVWQVGGNDALARVDIEEFSQSLAETVGWIKSHGIDVVLVDPQYTASLAKDDYYRQFVQAIQKVAEREQVPLVQRYEAMRYLATRAISAPKGEAAQAGAGFRLADLGYRCMAEHVTRAITVSLLQPDGAPAPVPPAAH